MKYLLVTCLLPLLLAPCHSSQTPRTAQVLDYTHLFTQSSEVSVIVIACGGRHKLELTLKSFFYYNTYRIRRMFIVHCARDGLPLSDIMPYGYDGHREKFVVVGVGERGEMGGKVDDAGEFGVVEALDTVYAKIQTKYVYQLDDQWAMVKGFGFIEQAINILEYAEEKGIKISQVVSNYPYWRAVARLAQMSWTDTGQAWHQIIPFSSQTYPSLTLSPSVFNFPTLYTRILNNSLQKVCSLSQCPQKQPDSLYEHDRCCLWAIGREIYREGYLQAYLNDGTGEANHQFIAG